MEASQTGPEQPQEGEQADPQAPEGQEGETPQPQEGEQASEGAEGAEGAAEDADERNPARDQAPVATDAQEKIIGDPGLRDEQQPVQNEGTPSNADTPNRTSAPPPSAQSGTPLPEERDAGDEPAEGEGERTPGF